MRNGIERAELPSPITERAVHKNFIIQEVTTMDKMSMEELGFFLYMEEMERQQQQEQQLQDGGEQEEQQDAQSVSAT